MSDQPTMTEVKSSNVHSVGLHNGQLYIRFKGKGGVGAGPLYRYPSASSDHHANLLSAPSPGKYFLEHLRNQHQGIKVDG